MKRLVVLLLILTGSSLKAQLDVSTDVSFLGVYPTVKLSYPLYDAFIIGGAVGYNVTNYYLDERIDLVLGAKCNEWTQVELDLGVLAGFNRSDPERLDKQYLFHADFGLKMHFANNLFCTLQIAYPGFIKFGLGVRLRPYKKLTVWDKQN